jgi:hypothetical protein
MGGDILFDCDLRSSPDVNRTGSQPGITRIV